MLQFPLASQVTVADPTNPYPVLQLYVTVHLFAVCVGVPGDPLPMDRGKPQEISERIQSQI